MRVKKIIPFLVSASLIGGAVSVTPSYALIPVTDAALNSQTTLNQVMNYIIYVEELINSYNQITNQLDQIQNQAKNLANMPMSAWDNAQDALSQMSNIMSEGNNISYAMQDVSAKMKQMYPGYEDFSTTSGKTYQQQYKGWTDDNMQNLTNTMGVLRQNNDDMQNESGLVNQLKSLSGGAQGNLQAVQAGNQIAAEQVAQLQKLRALMMAQTQAQTKYMAMQTQKEAAAEKTVSDMMQNTDTTWHSYQNDSSLGNVPSFR